MYYFDWSATTPISKGALEIYCKYSAENFGNPSSAHQHGRNSAKVLEECRKKISQMLKTSSEDIFFTSGGTESNSIILNSLLNYPTSGEIIVSSIEHPAISEYRNFFISKGWKFTSVTCPNGYINQEKLKESLSPNVKVVCIMAVNNVTGTIQNLSECVKIIREYSKSINRKIHIHCDAVQAGGKIEFFPYELDLDSASFSAHKFYGPRGIGILYNRNKSLLPLSKGGGQEHGLRPGTENLPAISAMTYALEEEIKNLKVNAEYVSKIRNKIEDSVVNNGFSLISPSYHSSSSYSPYIICLSADGIPSEVFLRVMSDKGFSLSATSACSTSSKAKAESVLSAMNISPVQRGSALRISLSQYNSEEDVDKLISALIETKKELKI